MALTKEKQFAKWFGVGIEKVETIKAKRNSCYHVLRYYLHLDEPEKHQYDKSEICSSENVNVEAILQKGFKESRKSEILEACSTGIITRENYSSKITVEEFARYKRQIEAAWEFYENMKKINGQNDRCVKTIYISGKSGLGKTTCAKLFAEENGLSTYVTSQGKNPFDDYNGQECVILDDFRPFEPYSFVELIRLIDPYTDSKVAARYKNKHLECSLIIITSVLTTEEMVRSFLGEFSTEDPLQFYRRLSEIWKIGEDKIEIYEPCGCAIKLKCIVPNPIHKYLETIARNGKKGIEIDSKKSFNAILEKYDPDFGCVQMSIFEDDRKE